MATPTLLPCAAKVAAMFALVLDLPVPPRKECIEIIFAKMTFLCSRAMLLNGQIITVGFNFAYSVVLIYPRCLP